MLRRTSTLLNCLIALCATWTLFASQTQAQPSNKRASPTLSIVDAKAYLGQGKTLEHATVVLRDGKIVSVKAKGAPAQGSTVLKASGQVLTAGLTAVESQLGLYEVDMEASTDDREPDTEDPVRAAFRPARAVSAETSLFGTALRGGVTNAAVTPTGGLVSGQIAWIDVLPGAHEDLVVNPSVGMRASLGQGSFGSRAFALERLETLLDDAKLIRAKRAAYERGDLRELSATARDLLALEPVLRGQMPLLIEAHRASDILAALDLGRRYNLKIALVGATQAWKVAPAIAQARAWVVLRPTFNLPRSFSTLGSRMDNAALLHQAGVRVVISNVDSMGLAHTEARLRQEAGNAVAHGLPYEVAIDAITLHPAQLFGQDSSYGRIAPGYRANLVLWSGDPLELSTQARTVIVRGQSITAPSRQIQLRERYRDLGRLPKVSQPVFRSP